MYPMMCLPLAKFGLKYLGQNCEQIPETHRAGKKLKGPLFLAPVSKENLHMIQDRQLLIWFLWHIQSGSPDCANVTEKKAPHILVFYRILKPKK